MGGTRRDFLRRVGQAGGYRATYLTMQAMGLLGAAAVATVTPASPSTHAGLSAACDPSSCAAQKQPMRPLIV